MDPNEPGPGGPRGEAASPSAAELALKITKFTVDVDVRTARGDEHRVAMFLSEALRPDGRSERFQDVLGERRFTPVQREGQLELFSVAHAIWFRIDLFGGFDELDPLAERVGAEAAVRVDLEDGTSLSGVLRWYMPPGRRRLVDYLALLPAWVPLRTAEWLYLLNRDRVLRVVPLEES